MPYRGGRRDRRDLGRKSCWFDLLLQTSVALRSPRSLRYGFVQRVWRRYFREGDDRVPGRTTVIEMLDGYCFE